ncbi:MAG TPA: ABC transporter ATP-binding protein [Pseudonocardiaceae bacterium]|jgi:ABC-2 type transport system ATP-binding protein|nr:ABC transporter ATP-binding protein [Pseudonocardiaceae bacterium]
MTSADTNGQFALRVNGLGKEYRSRLRGNNWALRDCTFGLPAGRVVALVGANGAGKTTLLSILAGLLAPTEGHVTMGGSAQESNRVAFVAQDKPLYRHFSVLDMLKVGQRLNRVWDDERAKRWLSRFDIPLDRPCGRLSGGQQAHVSFAIAVGSRPSVLLLDEPLSNLDPLARRDVTQELLSEVTDTDMTVLLSTHVVAELGGVADHVLLLSRGNLLVDSDADDLLTEHIYYVGPRADQPPGAGEIIKASHSKSQSTFLVRVSPADAAPSVAAPWTTRPVSLEDLVIAYLESDRAGIGVAA